MDERTPISRHPDSIGEAFLWALFLSLALFLIAPAVSDAQQVVMTNITPSALPACPGPCGAGVTIVTPLPPGTTVTTITGGARPGNGPNLFHSFGRFDVGTGDIANFFNETGLPTSNILSRVTGGNQSQIYGTIQTTNFPGANLFLMNPAGVLFGATAVLDLGAVTGSAVRQPGSFYATTANYLKLGDADGTSHFYADPAQASVLSVAPVTAFGFLGPGPPTPITVQGSILQVPEGQSLSLVGGDITIQSGTLGDGTIQAASLLAPGGHLNLVSVASPGEVLVPSFQTGPNIDGAPVTTMGTVTIKEGAMLDVSGQFDVDGNLIGNGNSGTVFVRAGQLVMDASTIMANTVGAVDGASTAVDIQVSQDVALTTGSAISTLTSGPGGGGNVKLTADTVTMEGNSTIFTGAFNDSGDGIAGDVVLSVREVSLMGGSSIQSQSQSFTPGLGHGNVTIQGLQGAESGAAESVTLSGGSSLVSTTFSFGDGGQVAITAQSLTMEGPDTTINASTIAEGHGGDIVVRVQHASLLEGATIKTLTGSADPNAPAAATVTVQGLNGRMADSVVLSGFGSGIVAETLGSARSGNVTVESNKVSLTDGAVIQTGSLGNVGTAGNVTIDAGSVDISGGSRISSLATSTDVGQVTITANALTLNNGSIDTFTSSIGRGGDVVLNVGGTLSLTNGAAINSSTSGTGRAGGITMNVGTLTLNSGSQISSASTGTEPTVNFDGTTEPPGPAGNFTITAAGAFTGDASTIATSAEANHGGDISITAQNVQLSNGTLITASSKAPLQVTKLVLDQDGQLVPQVVGNGNAGNLTIQSGSTVVMHNSLMTTEASQASGGQFTITAPEMVWLTNSRISTSVFGGTGSGGNITIDPQFVILQNSQIFANAFGGLGVDGSINITAGLFLVDPNSVVAASGQIILSGTVQNLGAQLTPLSQQFSSAAALLFTQRCAADPTGQFSSFVQTGRDGVPQVPGALSPSPLSFLETLTSGSLGSRSPNWAAARLGLDSVRVDDSTRFRFHSACRS